MAIITGVGAALAVASGTALGSLSGGAPPFSTNAPDPTLARVVVNGPDTTSGTAQAQFQVCFNKPVQTITSGSGAATTFVGALRLIGYGGNGSTGDGVADSNYEHQRFSPSTQTVPLKGGAGGFSVGTHWKSGATDPTKPASQTPNTGYTADAASNPSDPSCVNVTITPPSGGLGVDLNSFTQVGVDAGAALGSKGLGTTPATVGLDAAGKAEVTPIPGASSGPKLVGVFRSGLAPNQIGYLFNLNLDPNNIGHPEDPNTSDKYGFGYYDSSGNAHWANSISVSNNQVVATFGSTIVNDVYWGVVPGSVYSQSQSVRTVGGSVGGPISSVPTLRSAAPVSGVKGAYDLTYDQCVTDVAGNHTFPQLFTVLEDNTVVNAPQGSVSRPSSDCRMIRVSFGSITNYADFDSKVVAMVDGGGEVKQQASPNNLSAASLVPLRTPSNFQEGYSDGPNLVGFTLDTPNSTATYYFDNQYGALNTGSAPQLACFGLVYSDGTNSIDAGSAGSGITFTGPNQVTVQFNPSQVKNVVGGAVGTHDAGVGPPPPPPPPCDKAVRDYQRKGNLSPLVSGIGITNSGSTTTTTTSRTSTTSTRTTSGPKAKKCPRGKHRSHGRCVKNKKHKKAKKHKKHKKCPKGDVRRHGKCVKKR